MGKKYTIQVSKQEDIEAVYNINTSVYKGSDVIDLATLLEWHQKNPAAIHVIVDSFGKIVGNFNILPIKNEFMHLLLTGEIIEKEIKGAYLFSPAESNKVEYLYMESIVNTGGISAIIEFLRQMPTMFSRLCLDLNSIKKIYCLAASPEGKSFIDHLGFTEFPYMGEPRRDGHDKDLHQIDMNTILQKASKILKK